MKTVLLIGLGRFGKHIAMKMNELHHQVMAVDKNEERVEALLPYVTNAQIGDSTNEEFLKSLGVRNFDLCIVTIGSDFQSSLETTSLLKELGAKLVVSRASRDIHAKFLLRNGADEVLYPERQLASWAAIRYTSDHIADYVEIDKDYGIFEVEVPMNWYEKSIRELDIRNRYNVNILGIKRDEKISMNIAPDTQLMSDDTIMVLGKFVDVQKCFHI
ncbi:MAG: TrkA family potassium uptake protein [Lachnospiraceae bacterium]|nr:TrkA family potassium uptake protein [bacterium]MDY5517418.1 TrkA family potassium uptake protein [Lachnospiraceae bacterium]